MRDLKIGGFYRHFKGKNYQVIAQAKHSETGEDLVIYQALYGEFGIYARPKDMFLSPVDKDKYPGATQFYRFEAIEKEQLSAEGKSNQKIKTNTIENDIALANAHAPKQANLKTEDASLKKAENNHKPDESEENEGVANPYLLEFIDAQGCDEKLDVIKRIRMKNEFNDKLIDDLAVVMDVVIEEGALEDRIRQLVVCVETRRKYETNRLR